MPPRQPLTVAIAGAGIAGLSAALAFARTGARVILLERASVLGEVGAGIQLSPNATRLLDRLGVLKAVTAAAVAPGSIVLKDAVSLREVASLPLGEAAVRRWGAPYLVVHRADLQAALLEAVRARPAIVLKTDVAVAAVRQEGGRVIVSCEGEAAPAELACDVLVGADGVWSTVRTLVGGSPTRPTGHTAWRATVGFDTPAGSALEAIAPPRTVTAFLHPKMHLVAYPVKAGAALNLVALGSGPAVAAQWANVGDAAWLRRTMSAMGGPLATLAETAGPWTAWPIHEADAASPWHKGRVALIGDAAHAMTPFAAQGGAMAIEDAAVLARLAAEAGDPLTALARFEAVRRPRVRRVAARAAFNHFAYHARGPVALARNLVLALRPGASLAADFDWLYGYDAEAEA